MFTSGIVIGLVLGAFLGVILSELIASAKHGDYVTLTREEYLRLMDKIDNN